MDTWSQNCLANLASSSEEPLNTSNPWGQISQDSLGLLGRAPGLASMATQDASPSGLAPLSAPPPRKTAELTTTAPEAPSSPW